MLLITDCEVCGNDKYDGVCGFCLNEEIKRLKAENERYRRHLEYILREDSRSD